MANSNPRVKRPFQPTIDSYFTQPKSSPNANHKLSPPIPNNVQSSLLSVGMRVRKAVPEGYKTHKTLTDVPDIPPTTTHIATSFSTLHPEASQPDHPPPIPQQRPAELLPFCGLLKTGNFATQDPSYPVNAYALPGDLGIASDGTTSFSSQESNVSHMSSDSVPAGRPGNTRKRVLREYEEEDAEMDAGLGDVAGMRQFAVAKSGGRKSLGGARMVPGDFEEAEFLQPREWVDEDVEMEVEMGL
ncbi:hypothetical protein P152DRAFT_459450 [Eremomyces bilateralis CBS 781.70]|uniref:Uncharacterized protein n=1 Tax=Eremomyces bilateralis CBS 781.70 TaxID=1392243 RepID=A0A6G1G0G1_9PEZI|nr:uncharacterized protein P152DRAFT_459450 [Eremomyces bilateralis CBS 781.70]KAF1811508.1 hypothetical protein P152DRAFT_459450 [Eremomyces bilateralis CBS 781.70]